MQQLGCSTLTFRMLDLNTALDWIAADGFKTIDLGVIAKFCQHVNPTQTTRDDWKRLADEIGERGLRVSTCNAWSLTALNRPEGPDEELAWLRASLQLASALGCYALSMQPGRRTETDWLAHAKLVTTHINELGKYARDLGIRLAVEAPHKGTLAETFSQALEFLDLINPDLVGVVLDTSHIHNGGSNIVAAVATYGERVCHVHVRDYKNGSIMTTPGDGECDFAGFFQALKQRGYRGDFNLELEYHESTAGYNREQLHRAANHLRTLV